MLCSELFLITFEQKASIFLVQFIAKLDVYYRGVLKCNLQLRECRLWCLEPRVLRALRPNLPSVPITGDHFCNFETKIRTFFSPNAYHNTDLFHHFGKFTLVSPIFFLKKELESPRKIRFLS